VTSLLGRNVATVAMRFTCLPIVMLVAGCGLLGPPDAAVPIDELTVEPRDRLGTLAEAPTGPHIEVLSGRVLGERLVVAVQRDASGVCMAVFRGSDGSEACGPLPGADGALGQHFGMVLPGRALDAPASEPFEVAGMVVPEVSSVVVELDDGRTAAAQLVPLDAALVDAKAFIVHVPGDLAPGDLVARAADGSELERLGFGISQ
jgi:hypothetical protein